MSSYAGRRIVDSITGTATSQGHAFSLKGLPKSARVVFMFDGGRTGTVYLKHQNGTQGAIDVPSGDMFQSGPWIVEDAPTLVTSDGSVDFKLTVILVTV